MKTKPRVAVNDIQSNRLLMIGKTKQNNVIKITAEKDDVDPLRNIIGENIKDINMYDHNKRTFSPIPIENLWAAVMPINHDGKKTTMQNMRGFVSEKTKKNATDIQINKKTIVINGNFFLKSINMSFSVFVLTSFLLFFEVSVERDIQPVRVPTKKMPP